MKLSTIEFKGYKRLQNASCNVDGHVIAFIGPNESGKSSVLRGLSWLSDDDEPALSLRDQNRRAAPSDQTLVVRARYRIDEEDLAALQELNLDTSAAIDARTVTEFRRSRRKNGEAITGIETSLTRNPQPFQVTHDALSKVKASYQDTKRLLAEYDVHETPDLVRDIQHTVDPKDLDWDEERVSTARELFSRIDNISSRVNEINIRSAKVSLLKKHLANAVAQLGLATTAGELPDPKREMRLLLAQRAPEFILFTDNDRELAENYNLGDENLRNNPPAPLRNLLTVAETTAYTVWAASVSGDPAIMRTLERKINATIREKIEPMWTQARLTIDVTLNQGGLLEVNIQEIDSPDYTVTPIAERSDGLRAFLGLVCFLIAANLPTPPVLLIDEAERNLHYDAQADLVRVLSHELRVHKVIYTTHSPGCLPLDLGTGIRVVSRNPRDPETSILENNFWTKPESGFSHLLFAMGAEAAAFSAFRRAVLAEGVSEMILLPTLLRNASDGSQLNFQVAFGLSNLSAARAINEVALITTFLVDGDASGDIKKQQLTEAGVPGKHVFQLPKGKAIEDLVDRKVYLKTVNELLGEQGKEIPIGTPLGGATIAKAVDDYVKAELDLPKGVSHKIIASRLALLGDGLALSAVGQKFLAELRPKLENAFTEPYVLQALDT
ncbi:AAA family ATPase [Clavibacter michiganensis]|uniref:AAA family ATPase n=1 Tax=Clavibacter michiganensis TaxID=28447 RepID=UPI0026DB9D07|nr:AAA family ATPase [Clavibacter michiganensis]MDO4026452.1 AAA family ATPase [Clavibacter michiganensis]MDO4035770.1 AAA family ATPase [Clavibacter michiganensis]MDO4046605.1 AAA family ATPase [Clavibacter michiganensis]MDO4102089.1 AAA family ATPase [Clavibacter michiganensis]MDO4105620.1 AAA family ATPase [Clavibacter michiganensis]